MTYLLIAVALLAPISIFALVVAGVVITGNALLDEPDE